MPRAHSQTPNGQELRVACLHPPVKQQRLSNRDQIERKYPNEFVFLCTFYLNSMATHLFFDHNMLVALRPFDPQQSNSCWDHCEWELLFRKKEKFCLLKISK